MLAIAILIVCRNEVLASGVVNFALNDKELSYSLTVLFDMPRAINLHYTLRGGLRAALTVLWRKGINVMLNLFSEANQTISATPLTIFYVLNVPGQFFLIFVLSNVPHNYTK